MFTLFRLLDECEHLFLFGHPPKLAGVNSLENMWLVGRILCYSAGDAELTLKFDGDELFGITYTLKYPPSSYNQMISQYNKVVEVLKSSKTFKYVSTGKVTDGLTKEQIGEEWSFRNPQKVANNNVRTTVRYTLDRPNEFARRLLNENKETYKIEVDWVDLNFTVLDDRGWR